jgi:threonine synthase
MKHISTRGQSAPLSFDEIVLSGLAPDGGLYMPETWPRLTTTQLEEMRGKPFAHIAAEVVKAYAGPATRLDVGAAVRDAYANFRHPQIAPVRRIHESLHLLELFHGPTFAFKDFALQVLGHLMAQRLSQTGERRVIVAATSGDTGSAAISALAGRPNIEIVVLHPHNRVSEIQRRQMTTVDAANVHNIALEGDFDDAQSLVKALFNDRAFSAEYPLGAVNSINWARLAIQAAYYVSSSLALEGRNELHYVVPTGNFGDIFSGYAAKRLGAVIGHLHAATNENRIVADALYDGVYARGTVTPTLSPSMDIQVASNFERLLFSASGGDASLVNKLMADFSARGEFRMPSSLLKTIQMDVSGDSATDAEILETMRDYQSLYGEVIDPHTAAAVWGILRHAAGDRAISYVALATAHPAKFGAAVKRATGVEPTLPPELERLMKLPERMTVLTNDINAVKAFIRTALTAKSSG